MALTVDRVLDILTHATTIIIRDGDLPYKLIRFDNLDVHQREDGNWEIKLKDD